MIMRLQTFIDKYSPVMEHGEIKRYGFSDHDILGLLPDCPQLVWTAIDADGTQLLVAGMHKVNRLYHVRTFFGWENDGVEVRL